MSSIDPTAKPAPQAEGGGVTPERARWAASASWPDWLLIFLGGFLGSTLRYLTDLVSISWAPALGISVPSTWMLFLVNVIGAFILGWLSGREVSSSAKLLFGTGMCGAFTTYGSLMLLPVNSYLVGWEVMAWSLLWAAIILALGLAAAAAGWKLGARRTKHA
ncbi:hypothetical protein BK816_08835 [Boudabousia tangfeifanii]|uniref:Fluoride-specific ion channel FluC n=1 Tax=Boudabousia tangfeifanii TaxID=1912795 RepID=A0A1D9MM42_9ACTO|nr:CrcB family protein [Boudabousia tangfeifanii]AOZ73362.1 hypothetical protein BK816_08835 [Boudabousia tangfeifanii]